MARVSYGAIITDLKGSIGGITFQANGNSKIARLRSTRHKKNSIKQYSAISQFQSPLSVWNAMDQSEKDDFSDFAAANTFTNKWGTVKTLTGFQYFMSLGNNALLCSNSVNNSPPTWSSPLVVPSFTLTTAYNSFLISFSPSFAHADEHLLVYTSPLLRSVSLVNRKTLRLTKIIAPTTSSSINFLTDWESTHNIAVPIAGSPSYSFIMVAILTISDSTDLASVFNSDWNLYSPS